MDTLKIEVRYQADTQEIEDAMVAFAMRAAKDLLSAATLVCRRPPEIAVHTKNFFAGEEEIKVVPDDE